MPEEELPLALWTALGVLGFMLVLIWIGQLRLRGRLRRIESMLRKPAAAEHSARNEETEGQKRQFEKFLDVDPALRELPKKEQFAAYRKWRDEQGLNWGKAEP